MKQIKRSKRQRILALLLTCSLLGSCVAQGISPEAVRPQGSQEANRLEKPDVSASLERAMEKNSDVVGWLTLPNTEINEAVVQARDNEYYLRRDAEKKYSYEGCYYMDYESVMFDDGRDLAMNTIIYGHNLGKPMGVRDDPNGAKFAQLLKLNDEKVAKKTPYVFLTTKGASHVFQIFAAFYCEAFTKPVSYHHAEYSAQELKALTADAKARSTYLYDVEVSGDDKILTLSTCTYKYGTYSQNSDQRFVVMARLVKTQEPTVTEAPIRKNPSPKEPVFA